MRNTWLTTSTPKRESSWRASAPAATRMVVSRALARSRMSRMSSRSYLSAPARSAWPGRGRVTGALRAPVASAGGSAPTYIVFCQLVQSRLRTTSATGPPSVSPLRMPDSTSAVSDSMAMRRPRP